jgi:hypothetical protein
MDQAATEIEKNVTEAARLYRSGGHDCDHTTTQDRFDIQKFTQLITDLICIRDEQLFCTQPEMVSELVPILASHVDAPEGSQFIEIPHLVQLFRKWSEVITLSTVQSYGGANLPNLGEELTVQILIDLHQQRKIPIPFHCRHQLHRPVTDDQWVYTTSDRRGMIVPIEMIQQRNNWQFHDHEDGTGLLYSWPGSTSPQGQQELLFGTCVGTLVQRPSSLGAPTIRMTVPAVTDLTIPHSESTSDQNEMNLWNPMVSDSHISFPTDTPDPRIRLLEEVNERLQRLGYLAIEVGSGGDCFFRCLSAQHSFFNFQPTNENSLLARQIVVEYLTSNETLYRDFIAYDEHTPNYQIYLHRMAQPNTWIEGGLEVLTAAIVFNVRIHIFGSNSNHDRVVCPHEPNEGTRDIYMVHYHDFHYRVLETIPSLSSS